MEKRKRHHFVPWSQDRSQLGGFAKATLLPGDAHSHCTACGVQVKIGQKGGVKFWVNGRWASSCPCYPKSA